MRKYVPDEEVISKSPSKWKLMHATERTFMGFK